MVIMREARGLVVLGEIGIVVVCELVIDLQRAEREE
jgi:hypothetical protein